MSENANIERKCERCGAPLAADAPEGLCPRCLMALNLAAQTEAPGAEAGPGGTKVVLPQPEPPPPLEEIARHFPQLEILECLGRGGMGVVYKARQPRLDRFVALKILAREKEKDPRFAERFTREAQALARLNHPNIVTVYDFGEADGLYYLLMEYVDGMNLRQLLQNRSMAPEEALAIVPAICEALQYAHQQGIVHRDVKPENILLDKQGRVKIADFGIAKLLSAAGPMESLTGEQQVVGTPHYMAPEQVEKPGVVDHRADIYSLGVVLYEMLTGELPLGKFAPPSRRVKVDVRLDEVVLHALEKEPERRYQQASQVKSDVETIATTPGGGAAAPPPVAAPAEVNPWQPAILLLAGLVFGALLLLAGTIFPRPINLIAFLFGTFGLVVAVLKLAGVWPFPSGLFPKSNFTRRNLGSTTPAAPPSLSPSEDVFRQVKAPAIGLIVVAILNWVAIPFLFLFVTYVMSAKGHPAVPLLFVPVSALVLSSIMLIAGLKMKRLQAYGLAIAGAILAILVTPGNLVGLPVGVWALVVLSQRRVREAFGKDYSSLPSLSGQPSHGGGGWKIAAVIVAAVMLLLAIPVAAILLSIGIPAFLRARTHAKVLQQQAAHPVPTFVIRGTVTDAVTGHPISGARVDDNAYGARPNRSPQQAWTDAQGHYELRTWNEEHTVTASAPGYQTKLETFVPGPKQSAQMDFQLQPAENTEPTSLVQPTLRVARAIAGNGNGNSSGEGQADEDNFMAIRPIKQVKQYQDVRFKDMSKLDLSTRLGLPATLWFNQKTVWPARMQVNPADLLTRAMNPGLAIRKLHEAGLTGKGVNVAIIDQPLYQDHPEFSGKIAAYQDVGCGSEASMHGPAVASLLVGTRCGTAPGARLYYVAAPSWSADSAYQAKALDWIIEQNAQLPPKEKIRVVSVSCAPSGPGSPFKKNTDQWDPACERAEKAGILVLDCTTHHGFIGPCYYDASNFEDPTLCKPGFPRNPRLNFPKRARGGRVLVPCSPRTTAEEYVKGECGYQYCGEGGLSWSIPYCAGVLALGWQARPDLTAQQMRELLFKSAHKTPDGWLIINPPEFIRLVKASAGQAG